MLHGTPRNQALSAPGSIIARRGNDFPEEFAITTRAVANSTVSPTEVLCEAALLLESLEALASSVTFVAFSRE